MKILIIGGYGIFGGRIVELLEDSPQLTLFVGGRSAAMAARFVNSRQRAAARIGVALDDLCARYRRQIRARARTQILDRRAQHPIERYASARFRGPMEAKGLRQRSERHPHSRRGDQ